MTCLIALKLRNSLINQGGVAFLVSNLHRYYIRQIKLDKRLSISIMDAELIILTRVQFEQSILSKLQQPYAPKFQTNYTNSSVKDMENSEKISYVVIQFGWNKKQEFEKDHIKNAVYLDSAQIQQPPQWLLKPSIQLKKTLYSHLNKSANWQTSQNQTHFASEHEIKKQWKHEVLQNVNSESSIKIQTISSESKQEKRGSRILVYNRDVNFFQIIPACRLAILLLHYKIGEHIDILAGGFEQYQNQNTNQIKLIRLTARNDKLNNCHLIIDYEELSKCKEEIQLVDTRTLNQYEGRVSGYDYMNRKGRIPGSIYHGGHLSSNSCEVKQYSLSGQFVKMWKEQQIDLQKRIVLYCGSGWRASQILVYAAINGVKSISLYSNGWFEWSKLNNVEAEKGVKQENSGEKVCRRNKIRSSCINPKVDAKEKELDN